MLLFFFRYRILRKNKSIRIRIYVFVFEFENKIEYYCFDHFGILVLFSFGLICSSVANCVKQTSVVPFTVSLCMRGQTKNNLWSLGAIISVIVIAHKGKWPVTEQIACLLIETKKDATIPDKPLYYFTNIQNVH